MEVHGTVLVAGAGSGIGRATAQKLALLGASVVVCADINYEAAKETALICENVKRPAPADNIKAVACSVDVRDEGSVNQLISQVVESHGRLDVFVNTAGLPVAKMTPIRDMSLADWRTLDDVHSIGSFLLTRAALRAMDSQDPAPVASDSKDKPAVRGTIVILTSVASEGTLVGIGHYTAAKHAVKGMVETVALENAARGIRINAVAPSYVSGPMVDKVLEVEPGVKNNMLADLPLGRLAEPGEVADAVAFLASSASSYINGHTLVVDGGASLALFR